MKLKNILTGSIALSLLAVAARADVEVRITGATAFRAAALNEIKAQYDLGNGGVSYTYAHNKAAGGFNGADRVTFKGKFPGVTGTTTIRCSFNGSVEGIRALINGGTDNAAYITDAALANPGTDAGEAANENANVSASTSVLSAKMCFSDVLQSSTPLSTATALNPSDPRAGIIVFVPAVGPGTPSGFTNATTPQLRALFGGGSIPAFVFTGNSADTSNVYAVGRNDGSGTRTTQLAETGFGIANTVNHYIATTSTGTAVSVLSLTKAGGSTINGTLDTTSASTVWSQDQDGNGGWFSGGSVKGQVAKTTSSCTVKDAQGFTIEGPTQVYQLTWISTSDSLAIKTGGGKILTYNGVGMDNLIAGNAVLTAGDVAKVAYGQYSAWGTENFYYTGSLSADETTVHDKIIAGLPANLNAAGNIAGIPLTSMHVSRSDDGAPAAP